MPLLIKNRKKFPAIVQQYQCLKGISIGGCVDKKNRIGQGIIAHAHSAKVQYSRSSHKFCGWICCSHKKDLTRDTLLHEVAHLLAASRASHGKQWLSKLVEIGGDFISQEFVCEMEENFPWLKKHWKNILFMNDKR